MLIKAEVADRTGEEEGCVFRLLFRRHVKKVFTFAGNEQSVGKFSKWKNIKDKIDDNLVYIL